MEDDFPWIDKVGIRYRYPRLPLSKKLRAYLQLARPFTCLAVIVGGATGYLMAAGYGYTQITGRTLFLLAHGLGTLILAQIGSNYVNQAHDVEEDRINKPYRPIPRGLVTPDEAQALGHVAWIVAVLRAATLTPWFGVLVTGIVLASHAYSAPPLRAKDHPWINNLVIALPRGLLGVPAAWTVVAPVTAAPPWAAGAVLFVFLIGASATKDFHDVDGDQAARNPTLPVLYGPRRAAWIVAFFSLTPIATLPFALRAGVLTMPGPLVLAVLASSTLLAVTVLHRTGDTNEVLEGDKPWAMMYVTLMVMMTGFAWPGIAHLIG